MVPATPPNVSVLLIFAIGRYTWVWGYCGVVLDVDRSTEIVKRLKLTGAPYKITAFIWSMLSGAMEVAEFEGANIWTLSGIRGELRKLYRKQMVHLELRLK